MGWAVFESGTDEWREGHGTFGLFVLYPNYTLNPMIDMIELLFAFPDFDVRELRLGDDKGREGGLVVLGDAQVYLVEWVEDMLQRS